MHHDVIYPSQSAAKIEEAGKKIKEMVFQYNIEAIAIGNGTAGRGRILYCAVLDLRSR
ncbi:MAG: hypothetical protein MZU95_14555 [Desulfomicrobium escambiense]|nr:hypothetical protein [Desulfomicrobium escambiense]